MSYITCPACGGGVPGHPCGCNKTVPLPGYAYPPAPQFHPPGCICPPMSERTCENPACPRKARHLTATSLAALGRKEPTP